MSTQKITSAELSDSDSIELKESRKTIFKKTASRPRPKRKRPNLNKRRPIDPIDPIGAEMTRILTNIHRGRMQNKEDMMANSANDVEEKEDNEAEYIFLDEEDYLMCGENNEGESVYVCIECFQLKPRKEYSKHYGTWDKRDPRCKKCVSDIKNDKTRERKPRCLDVQVIDMENREWQGGKYPSPPFKNKLGNYGVNLIKGGQKTFNPKKYDGSDELALKAAEEYRVNKCDAYGLTKNKFKIVDDNYALVQISNYYVMLCDIDQLNFTQNHTLSAKKAASKTAKHYCSYYSNKTGDMNRFHGHVIDADMVDHINGYPLDNRKENLRATTYSENNANRTRVQRTIVEPEGDMFKAIVIQKTCTTTKIFNTEEKAITWIETKINRIDIHRQDAETQRLKKSYEDIMKEHCDGFKWRDGFWNENEKKQTALKKRIPTLKTPKERTRDEYRKFTKINPDFDVDNYEITNARFIENQQYDGITYRYCTSHNDWHPVDNFNSDVGKKGRKARICKEKSTEASLKYQSEHKAAHNISNKKWRTNNPTYQKNYRENVIIPKKQAQKYNELTKIILDRGGTLNMSFEDFKALDTPKQIIITCSNLHTWPMNIRKLINGQWCPLCKDKEDEENNKMKITTKTKSAYDNLVDIITIQGGKCITSLEDFNKPNPNGSRQVTVRCDEDHTWTTDYRNIIRGSWCHTCGLKVKDVTKKKTSVSMKAYKQSKKGKEDTKKGHAKRSETMKKQRDEIRANLTVHVCTRCKKTLPADKFSNRSAGRAGKQSWCKKCTTEDRQEKTAKNKENGNKIACEHCGREFSRKDGLTRHINNNRCPKLKKKK